MSGRLIWWKKEGTRRKLDLLGFWAKLAFELCSLIGEEGETNAARYFWRSFISISEEEQKKVLTQTSGSRLNLSQPKFILKLRLPKEMVIVRSRLNFPLVFLSLFAHLAFLLSQIGKLIVSQLSTSFPVWLLRNGVYYVVEKIALRLISDSTFQASDCAFSIK